jgi:hypothetical protein
MLEIKRGLLTIAETIDYTYTGVFMDEKKIIVTVYSLSPIVFGEGDFVVFRGDNYYLINEPTEHEVFDKEQLTYTLTFVHEQYQFDNLLFKDIVPNNPDNEYYNNRTSDVTFIGSVETLIGRIMANMDISYTGWSYVIDPSVFIEYKHVLLIDGTCMDAIGLIKSLFNLDYWIINKTVYIGGTAIKINGIFQYGKNDGICEMTRASESKKIITRLYINSSSRNIPPNYRVTATDLYNPKLMLPPPAEAKTNYIDSTNIDLSNIKEGVLENKDIFPSIENSTGQNEIVSVQTIEETDAGFVVEIKDLGFDIWDNIIAGHTPQIEMTSGFLEGYAFDIHEIDGQTLTLIRNTDIENQPLPNNITAVRSGDRYVILGIDLPESYMIDAQNRLLLWGRNQFSEKGIDKATVTYAIKLAEEQIARGTLGSNVTLGFEEVTLGFEEVTLGLMGEEQINEGDILEGNLMRIVDVKNDVNEDIPIQQLTITYKADAVLPTYDVAVSKSILSNRFTNLEKAQYAISQSMDEKIREQEQDTRRITKEIKKGNFIETRYAKNGSYLKAPPLVMSERNPSLWGFDKPVGATLETVWMIQAEISGVTDRLVEDTWSEPEGKRGVNTSSVVPRYKGQWDINTQYNGIATAIDIVKHTDDARYYARVDVGDIPIGTSPTDRDYWCPFELEIGSIATDLLFAELAYIENLGVRNLKTADTGKRVELIGDENNLRWYDENGDLKVAIDDEIFIGQSGIAVYDGIIVIHKNGVQSVWMTEDSMRTPELKTDKIEFPQTGDGYIHGGGDSLDAAAWSTSSSSPTYLNMERNSYWQGGLGSALYVCLPLTADVYDGTEISIGTQARNINILSRDGRRLNWDDSPEEGDETYSMSSEIEWVTWIKFGSAWIKKTGGNY